MAEPSQKPIIDVEQLVNELKERVERERAAGAYADDLSGVSLEVPPSTLADGFDIGAGGNRIQFRPELAFSSKPVIGPLITLVKKFFVRLLFFVLDDLARQADAAVTRLEMALKAEAAARESGLAARDSALAERDSAIGAVKIDVRSLSLRADEFEAGIERLQLNARLARLERAVRARATAPASATGAAPASTPAPTPPAGASIDYLAFESRFRPEETVRERQQAYVEDLRGAERVVDLGAGRGELVELLNEAGIPAYAVEIEPDFIELMGDKGIEVVAQDAVEHLRSLEPGSLGGIVASHVVEHLPASAVAELVALAGEKLAEGGTLILETPNPESLVAGSINFHRDLTHRRPIHPDTLVFLCDSAGFASVELRRLSPVSEDERLPVPEDGELEDLVTQLNELLYGYQDYAVVARRG
jgi:O-antigen chain-terminating methyltransferase